MQLGYESLLPEIFMSVTSAANPDHVRHRDDSIHLPGMRAISIELSRELSFWLDPLLCPARDGDNTQETVHY
jgi:hypothetical protein